MTSLTLPEVVALVRRALGCCEDGFKHFSERHKTRDICYVCTPLIRAIENDDVWRKMMKCPKCKKLMVVYNIKHQECPFCGYSTVVKVEHLEEQQDG